MVFIEFYILNEKKKKKMITSIILLLSLLLSVAFVTLLERSLLRYSQIRKGPNLVGIYGLLQPFRDGIKLLTKLQPF